MAKSINRVSLLGTLGRDAETKFLPSGVAVSSFSIATNRSWKDKESGEWKEETDWHNVTVWRKENMAQYLTRGSKVYVEGRLQTRTYEKDGEKRYVTEVIADEIVLCGGSNSSKGAGATGAPTSYSGKKREFDQLTGRSDKSDKSLDKSLEISDDDVPF